MRARQAAAFSVVLFIRHGPRPPVTCTGSIPVPESGLGGVCTPSVHANPDPHEDRLVTWVASSPPGALSSADSPGIAGPSPAPFPPPIVVVDAGSPRQEEAQKHQARDEAADVGHERHAAHLGIGYRVQ